MAASVDATLKALADRTRRALLDELFRQDGQTLNGLKAPFAMSRFGVMKHLKVLEDAGLVVSRHQGRETLHHLRVTPIRIVHDQWVSKFITVASPSTSSGC
jgi:DNA-binding transcriptional ArsR family regulator